MQFDLIFIIAIILRFGYLTYMISNRWLKLTFGVFSTMGLVFIWLLSSVKIGKSYYVQDGNGGFQFVLVPSKGRDFEVMYRRLESYKKENRLDDEVKLYRVMKKNYLDPSMWIDYQQNPYWDLEYLLKK